MKKIQKILRIGRNILAVIGGISLVVGFILQFQGVIDFTNFVDTIKHPVIIEPTKILVSEAIVKQKTICYLRNRSNKIQNNVSVNILVNDCPSSAKISVEIEPDAFRSIKIGDINNYVEVNPVAILEVKYIKDGVNNILASIASHDLGPLETQRISITIDPYDYDKWKEDSYISLEIHVNEEAE